MGEVVLKNKKLNYFIDLLEVTGKYSIISKL
jgi:hypothetical protein